MILIDSGQRQWETWFESSSSFSAMARLWERIRVWKNVVQKSSQLDRGGDVSWLSGSESVSVWKEEMKVVEKNKEVIKLAKFKTGIGDYGKPDTGRDDEKVSERTREREVWREDESKWKGPEKDKEGQLPCIVFLVVDAGHLNTKNVFPSPLYPLKWKGFFSSWYLEQSIWTFGLVDIPPVKFMDCSYLCVHLPHGQVWFLQGSKNGLKM